MTILFNRIELKDRRRNLRKNFTDAECKIWSKLRSKQQGYKFFRQYSVGPYILDFFCPSAKLGVELDGGQHAEDEHKIFDRKRTEYLNKNGIKILRFWDSDVLKNTDGVLQKIAKNLTPPTLLFKKEEG